MNFNPKFALYHATPDCDGSAIRLTLTPAVCIGDGETIEGFIELDVANQKKTDGRPVFDFDKAPRFRLHFQELSRILCVLKGRKHSLGAEDGLSAILSVGGINCLSLKHIGQKGDSSIALKVVKDNGCGSKRIVSQFKLRVPEVVGLTAALEHSMKAVTFGDVRPVYLDS